MLTLYDKLENISTAYQDISITFPKGNYDGSQTVTIEETGQTVNLPYYNMKGDTVTFYLPDGIDTLITYWAKPTGEVSPDGKIHYTNTATLKNYEKVVEESAEWAGDESGLATQYGVRLYKADGYVNSKLLAGAQFKLFIVDEEDEDGNIISGTPLKDTGGNDKIFTTNTDGTINIEGDKKIDGWNLKPEQRYYLMEVKAPDGFAIDTTKYSFIISAKGYTNYTRNAIVAPDGSGAIVQPWTYYNGDVLTVKDWPKDGELVITKNFDQTGDIRAYADLSEEQRSAITFEIYQKQKDESWKLFEKVDFDQFTLGENQVPSFTAGNLPAGTYKVIEVVNDTSCKEQTYAVTLDADSVETGDLKFVTINITDDDIKNHNTHSMTVTNKYVKESEFKIYKYANQGLGGSEELRLAGAEFGVFTVENGTATETQIGENYKTNGRGLFSIKPSSDSTGIQYDTVYALKEVKAPDGYQLSSDVRYFIFLSSTGTVPTTPAGIIGITYNTSVQEDIPNDIGTTSIGVKKIWQNEKLEEDTQKANTSVDVYIYQKATLDKAGKNIVREQSHYYPTDNGKITFTAQKNVDKWDLSAPVTAVLPDGVSIQHGRLTGLPKMMITDDGIPLYYHYSVEEKVPEGYTAVYSTDTADDGSTTITITNRPSSVQSFVQLKAEKKWFNADKEEITSEMGVEDGVIVDVCRKEGIVRDGIIVEADGTEKSAGDLFPLLVKLEASTQTTTNIETAMVTALPGDSIKIIFKPQNKEEIAAEHFEAKAGFMDQYGNLNGIDLNEKSVDLGNGYAVITYTADSNHNAIRVKVTQNKYGVVGVEVVNLSAQGRTQILSQNEANAVGGEKVETLELNKANAWKAESQEYSGGTGNLVYSYYLVEQSGENNDATYEVSGDNVVIKNIDKRLRVDKKWFRPDGETEIEQLDGTIVYNLYQVTNGREWQEGQFSGDGPFSVDISEFVMGDPNNQGQNLPNVTFTGDKVGIRAGSKVKITITKDNPNNGNMDIQATRWAPAFNVSGGNATIGEPYTIKDDNNQAKEKVREIIVSDVSSSIKLKGYMNIQGGNVTVNVEVLGEYDIIKVVDESQMTRKRVGQVTMSYDNATIVLDSAFAESGIKVKPEQGHWTSVISKLPDSGTDGEYSYYVTEDSISIDGFEFDSIDSNNAENGSTIIIKNKAKPAKVRVTKSFDGVGSLPENYKITNSLDSTEFTVTNKRGGNGTASDPYYWEKDNLVIGQQVTFYEWNFGIEGKEMTVEDMHGNEISSPYKVTATAVESIADSGKDTPGVTGFVNKYGSQDGALKLTKVVTVNETTPTADNKALTDGTYVFTIKGVADTDTAGIEKIVTITFVDGKATQYKIGTEDEIKITATDEQDNTWSVVVPNLTPGDYTIMESDPQNGTELIEAAGGKSVGSDKVVTVAVTAGDTTAAQGSAQATFTNNIDVGYLQIKKKVT